MKVPCPKCKALIDHLFYFGYELMRATLILSEVTHNDKVHTFPDYINWDSQCETIHTPNYNCPECDETLFHYEDEAEKFLKGELIYIIMT